MKRLLFFISILLCTDMMAQGVMYDGVFSPAEGLVKPVEQPYRAEICLDGYWQLQCVSLPEGWKGGEGIAPELPVAEEDKWESVPIKVPSPINVNNWGQGYRTGSGTDRPYTPSSIYYPSYPEHWNHVRMAWMKKTFSVPSDWAGKRILVHFEAVSGECAVYVNGVECARHFENHLPFDVDITDVARLDSENEILLGIRHHKLFDKKHKDYRYMGATYPHGSNTDDLIGVWQDVFLQAVPIISIEEVFIQPYVERGELVIETIVGNDSDKKQSVFIESSVRKWVSNVPAPEIGWSLSAEELSLKSEKVSLAPGERKKVFLRRKISEGELEYWSPDAPNLYTAVLSLSAGKNIVDVKSERFGWRELKIDGEDFLLNGKKIQCFGDIQHPFSAYICSRRFAWGWYRMIKDFGGNAVRPHAQPWPRCYYDLADEMGLMVLDETAVFGSSIRLNFEEEKTWKNCSDQLERLILRDRNHPSVIGWSAGNETFAIALLNKAPQSVASRWNDNLVDLALKALKLDPTRQFVTLDGDRDMDGRLPVWSKHFAHGLHPEDLPEHPGKPIIVGEQGATYYGKPDQLVQFAGMAPYIDYKGRNEALGRDLYQNVRYMALPKVAYFSPSEVSWFGLEHLNLGYSDFSRLPGLQDGIFPSRPYEEGVPGYQYERIPPYVTTFNPCLDPSLPLYKPLQMFYAYKAALAGEEWAEPDASYEEAKPIHTASVYDSVYIPGGCAPELASFLGWLGISISNTQSDNTLVVVDASKAQIPVGPFMALTCDGHMSKEIIEYLGNNLNSITYPSSALESDYFLPSELYFGGEKGDERYITTSAVTGDFLEEAELILKPSRSDWTLFNDVPEHWKCAQEVLYEALEKPCAACLVRKNGIMLSTIDYRNHSHSAFEMWKKIFALSGLEITEKPVREDIRTREFNLLLDGPVD